MMTIQGNQHFSFGIKIQLKWLESGKGGEWLERGERERMVQERVECIVVIYVMSVGSFGL